MYGPSGFMQAPNSELTQQQRDYKVKAYLHHGTGVGPFLTEEVKAKSCKKSQHKYSSYLKVLWEGHWYRVYETSLVSSYINTSEGKIKVQVVL